MECEKHGVLLYGNECINCRDDSQTIKRLVVDNQENIKRLTISKSAIEMFNFCRIKKGAMTREVANHFSIGITDASTRLKKLYVLGYLTRTEITSESGGIEFIYYAWE